MTDITKHGCRVGTARIDYQGRVGQRVLNTTVKSSRQPGRWSWHRNRTRFRGSLTLRNIRH